MSVLKLFYFLSCSIINYKYNIMKKRALKNLNLNKSSVSTLDNLVKGGAVPINSVIGCNNTGCVGPPRNTCGIINCDLQSPIKHF
jgi:hypothetical protein